MSSDCKALLASCAGTCGQIQETQSPLCHPETKMDSLSRTRSSCLPYRGRERIIMEHLSFLGSRNKGESKREIVLSLYTSYNLSKTHRMKTSSTNEQVYPRLCEISGSYGSVPNCLKETFLSPTMGCCHTPFFLWTRAPENDLLLWFSDLVSRSAASPSPGN